MKIKFEIDEVFKPLYTSKKRYFFVTGGRGSTKTFSGGILEIRFGNDKFTQA